MGCQPSAMVPVAGRVDLDGLVGRFRYGLAEHLDERADLGSRPIDTIAGSAAMTVAGSIGREVEQRILDAAELRTLRPVVDR